MILKEYYADAINKKWYTGMIDSRGKWINWYKLYLNWFPVFIC